LIKGKSTYCVLKSLVPAVLILGLICSCKKAEDRSCFKRSGEEHTIEFTVAHFDKLHLKEHVSFHLVQDTVEKVVLHGGKNLLNMIHVDVNPDNKEMTISNENRCRFLRYKTNDIIAYIHFIDLNRILFEGTDSLSNTGVINLDQIEITTNNGAGSIRLNINANIINSINLKGWSDCDFNGECNYFRSEVHGNASFNSRDLHVNDSITVISNSDILSKINSQGCKLKVELSGIGDLWYYGLPSEIVKKEYNSGRLIDKN